MSREIKFQQDLYFLLRKVIESEPEICGFRFKKVEMECPVDGGRSDIVVFDENNKPFIVIETKKKNGQVSRNIDPLSFNVIKQALGYAGLLGASFIVTANAAFFASFTTPSHGEAFSIERHRVLITQIQLLNADSVRQFLETVVKYHYATTYEEKNRIATGLDWTFIYRLRSFVKWLAVEVEPILQSRLEIDQRFHRRVSEFEQNNNTKLSPKSLALEMSYILTNKIVFYKILERKYPTLPKLLDIDVPRARLFLTALYRLFDTAIVTAKDFEAVFKTGLFDEIILPIQSTALLDILEGLKIFIRDMETYQLESLDADVVGHVYEELLPPEERHRLGQFYTPPAIAELICQWAIRHPSDLILDPAAGSGTFPVKSYQVLRSLKRLENSVKSFDEIHAENIGQIYTIDINPFPAHLTVNLAMRNVNHPISEMNVLREDFFKVSPNQTVLSPYAVKTAKGEEYRLISIPIVNVVVGNPPYTRWTELSEQTRTTIKTAIGSELSKFGLRAGSTQSEPMIYLHFLIHGTQFLESNGRLGMIISNSWLQADYGVKFGKYLLENFRIIAVIDFSPRVFRIPLIATLVLLLERETDIDRRKHNKTVYIFVDKTEGLTTEKLLSIIEHPSSYSGHLFVNTLEQQKLDSGVKWLNLLFGSEEILQELRLAKKVVDATELFTIATSNTGWAYWALKHGQ